MQLSKISILYVVLAVVGLSSCEKVIEFDAEVKKPKLVANSLFEQDSTWLVHISNSLSEIDDGELRGIENATVQVKDLNGNLIETLTHEEFGYYTGNTTPNVGQSYQLEVSAPTFDPIVGTSAAPNPVSIVGLDTVRRNDDGFEEMEISLTINDPANEANYYMIRIRRLDSINLSEGIQEYFWLYSEDPTFDNIDIGSTWLTVDDKLFDGQTKTLKFFSSLFQFEQNDAPIEVVLYASSEESYLYRRTLNLAGSVQDNPFAQPVQVYTNIDKGFGIFGGITPDIMLLRP